MLLRRRNRPSARLAFRPTLERLEYRWVPSTINLGEMDLTSGQTLNCTAGNTYNLGNNATTSNLAGTINVATGATLNLYGFALSGAIHASSGAVVNFGGARMLLNPGAITDGAGQYTLVGSVSYGPILTLNTDWATPSSLTINTNGEIAGPGALNVAGILNWPQGDIAGTGAMNLLAGSTTTVSGGVSLDTRTLNNSGTVTFTGGAQLSTQNYPTFNNQAGGTVSLQAGSNFFYGQGVFNNAGTLNTPTSGTTNVGTAFNNSGTVKVQGGILELDDGGYSSGTFNVTAGATLAFAGGPADTFNTGTTFTGGGTLHAFGSGPLNVNGTVTLPNLQIDSGTLNVTRSGSLAATGPVSVASGASISLTGGMTLSSGGSLNLAGTLSGAGTLTVASGAAFNWTGGQLYGPGSTTIQAGATFTLSSSSDVSASRPLSNAGTAIYSGTGNLDLLTGALWTNSGSFTLSSDTTIQGGGQGRITNTGTWTKSSATSSGTTLLDAVFSNASGGTVNVTKGILQLNAGGSDAGAFNVPSGQTLDFTGGYNTLSSGTTLGGTGVYLIDGATVAMPTALSVANLTLNTGTLTGSAALTLTGALAWTGSGTMSGSGSTTIVSGATLTLSGLGDRTLDTRTLTNAGTGTWSGTANWTLADSALFNNSGTFNAQNDQAISISNSPGTVANTGTWNKTSAGSGGTTTISTLFNNTGTVNVNSGVLVLLGGGTNTATFSVAASQALVFGTDYLLSSGASLGGSGTYEEDGGTVTDNANVTVANLTLTGGIWTGSGSLTVSHLLTWTGSSTMAGTGSTTVSSGATLALGGGAGNQILDTRTLTNAGSATWTGTGSFSVGDSAHLNNSGTFAIQNNSVLGTFDNMGVVTNTGTWTKSSGTTTVNTTFSNTGTVLVTSGGTLSFAGVVAQVSGNTLTAGTWNAQSATLKLNVSGGITAIGSGARVLLNGAGSVFPDLATLASNAGQFQLLNGATFHTAGGFSSSGTLVLSGSSLLTVNGAFTQTSTGSLSAALAGTNAKPVLSQISATGAVSLAGQLTLSGTVTPAVGTAFTLLSNATSQPAIAGTFAGLPEGATLTLNGMTFKIHYAAHYVVLTRTA